MTDQTRQHLTLLAARLELCRAQADLKQSALAHGRLSRNTVSRILHGKDHHVSTLFELADAMGYEVTIAITRRA